MPQGSEKLSNGRIDGGNLRREQQKEIHLGEDSLRKGDVDVGKYCNDLDGMPELKDDQIQLNSDEEVSLDLGEPSPEVIEYARRELGETDDVKCRTLQELRDMIYGNYYVVEVRYLAKHAYESI